MLLLFNAHTLLRYNKYTHSYTHSYYYTILRYPIHNENQWKLCAFSSLFLFYTIWSNVFILTIKTNIYSIAIACICAIKAVKPKYNFHASTIVVIIIIVMYIFLLFFYIQWAFCFFLQMYLCDSLTILLSFSRNNVHGFK